MDYNLWLGNVCEILGKDVSYAANLDDDIYWSFCYEDGLTPNKAIDEAKDSGIL